MEQNNASDDRCGDRRYKNRPCRCIFRDLRQWFFLLSHKIYHASNAVFTSSSDRIRPNNSKTDAPLDRFNMKKSSGNGYRQSLPDSGSSYFFLYGFRSGFLQKHTQNFYSEDFFCCFRFCFFPLLCT